MLRLGLADLALFSLLSVHRFFFFVLLLVAAPFFPSVQVQVKVPTAQTSQAGWAFRPFPHQHSIPPKQ
jgi:hypothetical protein